MVIKVGINSFGRIGRVIFRTCCENSEIEVAAINDPAIDLGYMCYLIKFDSTHGKFTGSISHEGNEIKINDRPVKVFHHKAPTDIPWHEAGVQYVVEASGMFTSVEKASGHLNSDGVRRVIVTAPSADGPMLILGVNEDAIQPDMKVVSCASSTLYCLAPIVKILEDAFGIADGFVTSIHAMTPSLKPLDGLCVRGKHWRDHRSIHQNIIPASTGACRALGRIVPACKDKLAGLAFRVPVVSVSVLDMCVRLNKNTTIDEITQIIEKLRNTALGNIIQVSNEKTVSSDFIGETHSCILDIDSSLQIKPNFFKLICWYENEYSYSCRVVDTVIFSARQFQTRISPPTRVMFMRPNRNHLTENSPANVRRQYLSFCVPTLQSNRSNMPCSPSFIMRPSATNESPKYQLGEATDFEKKTQSVKSYIDSFTKCYCNVPQQKTRVLETRKDPPEDKAHEKRQGSLKTIEKEISEMLNMTENLLNKSPNKKVQSVKIGSKKVFSEFAETRNVMRKNIIAKISDTLEKIRKEKMNTQNFEISGDNNSLLQDVDDCQDKASLSPRENDSLNNSHLKLPMNNSPTKIIKNVIRSNVSLEKSNSWVYWDSCSPKRNINPSSRETNKPHITNEKKTYIENKTNVREGKIECIKSSSLNDRTNIHEVKDTKSEIRDDLEHEVELWIVTPQDDTIVNDKFLMKRDESESNSHRDDLEQEVELWNVTPQDDTKLNDKFLMKRGKSESNSHRDDLEHEVELWNITPPDDIKVNDKFLMKRDERETNSHRDDLQHEVELWKLTPQDDTKVNDKFLMKCDESESDSHRDDLEHEVELWNVTSQDDTKVNNKFLKKRDESESNSHSDIQKNGLLSKSICIRRPPVADSISDVGPRVRFAPKENKMEQYVEEVEAVVCVNTLLETENYIGDELLDEKTKDKTQALPGCSGSTIENISESLSGIISNYTVTSVSKKTGPCVEDIYDKLDSESLSDSDSSFRIREKTSQVIRITDLTYSLEDLPRLDKICRVIEISDELSDKLFSPLDSDNYENTTTRTWSFQDLCERIKFDEFCNELFEKPAS